MATTVTDEEINDLMAEALAGDTVFISPDLLGWCRAALAGDNLARAKCAEIITDLNDTEDEDDAWPYGRNSGLYQY